jgi:protease PrsW
VWLTLLVTGTQVQWQLLHLGQVPAVTQAQVHLFTVLSWGLLILDAVLGLLILRGRWHKATTPGQPGSAADISLVAAEGKRQ